jgi:hypothetical protein
MVITHPDPRQYQLDLYLDGAEPDPAGRDRLSDEELMAQLADCERQDRTLLRMVLAATLATALLGLAGSLVA